MSKQTQEEFIREIERLNTAASSNFLEVKTGLERYHTEQVRFWRRKVKWARLSSGFFVVAAIFAIGGIFEFDPKIYVGMTVSLVLAGLAYTYGAIGHFPELKDYLP